MVSELIDLATSIIEDLWTPDGIESELAARAVIALVFDHLEKHANEVASFIAEQRVQSGS